jgi:PAS domain S-box-containing protein
MVSIENFNKLLDFFNNGTVGEALHKSLKHLEQECNLEGLAIMVKDTSKNSFALIASSQMKNIAGLPLSPLMKFNRQEELVTFTSNTNVSDLSNLVEIDLDNKDSLAGYFNKPIPSSNYNLIMIIFGTQENMDSCTLPVLSKLYSVILRDSTFLRQIKEKTNKVNIDDFTKDSKPKEINTYKELFESTEDGILVLDKDYNIQYINHSGESITGYARAGLINTPIQNIISSFHATLFNGPEILLPSNFDMDLITTSNETVRLGVNRSSILSDSDHIVLIFRNITEARIIEERLQSTSDFLIKLVDNSIVAIVACELNGNIILFNPSAQELFGYKPQEVVDSTGISHLFPNMEIWNGLLDKMTGSGFGGESKINRTKETILSKSNEEIPVTISAYIIPMYGDNKSAVILFLSDLRTQLSMENKLSDYKERLLEKEKQAFISDLAGALAHELNQPLMSILGYSTLLKKPNLDTEKLNRAIKHISGEADRMANIVKKIGNLTKYETRKYAGGATIVDLDKSSGDV